MAGENVIAFPADAKARKLKDGLRSRSPLLASLDRLAAYQKTCDAVNYYAFEPTEEALQAVLETRQHLNDLMNESGGPDAA